MHGQEQSNKVLLWDLSIRPVQYGESDACVSWPGKFDAQRFLQVRHHGHGQRFGGCVESSLACAYHTLAGDNSHRVTDIIVRQLNLNSCLGVPSATRCSAETRDERHVTAYLHLQVASWARTRVYHQGPAALARSH